MIPKPLTSTSKYVFLKQGKAPESWGHYWEFKDGSEGGELWLNRDLAEDFDGAFDLPIYVKEELIEAGYSIGWEMENSMENIKNLPKLKSIKPKRPIHKLDRLIGSLEDTRAIYEEILGRQQAFKERVEEMDPVKTNPKQQGGTPLRDFTPVNPLDEWTDVTTWPGITVRALEKQGLIATIKLEGRFYSRPA